jgi:hypothetical protein
MDVAVGSSRVSLKHLTNLIMRDSYIPTLRRESGGEWWKSHTDPWLKTSKMLSINESHLQMDEIFAGVEFDDEHSNIIQVLFTQDWISADKVGFY